MNFCICKNCEFGQITFDIKDYNDKNFPNIAHFNKQLNNPIIYEGESFVFPETFLCKNGMFYRREYNYLNKYTTRLSLSIIFEKAFFFLYESDLLNYFKIPTRQPFILPLTIKLDKKGRLYFLKSEKSIPIDDRMKILEGFSKLQEKITVNEDFCPYYFEHICFMEEDNVL